MAFFDGLGKKLASVAQNAGKATRNVADIARINGKISAHQSEIDELYAQIGRTYCQRSREGSMDLNATDIMKERIDVLENEIISLRQEIDRIKEVKRCPVCGAARSMNARFCESCGAELADLAPVEEAVAEEPLAEEETAEEAAEEPQEDDFPKHASSSVVIHWPNAPTEDEAKTDEHDENDEPDGDTPT